MAEEIKTKINHEKWFDENIKIYESLAANVANTLKTALDKNNIMYVDIPYRAKTKKSFLKKWEIKKYQDIDQVMDLAGIRVITLVESDLNEVEDLIKALFNIHVNDSGDKGTELGHEKFGYRSRHFICDIGPKREELIELDHFKGMRFEIQIRTALAHAWAEIEHDRGYKLEGGLPEEYKRRLNIVAAMLEGADNEFNRLTKEINQYTLLTQEQIKSNKLEMEISRVSLQELLRTRYIEYVDPKNYLLQEDDNYKSIRKEIDYFNIFTIQELNIIVQNALSQHVRAKEFFIERKSINTDMGFIRDILMFHDLSNYSKCGFEWGMLGVDLHNMLLEIYGDKVMNDFIKDNAIYIYDEE